jgi:hypothetical protein
MEIIREAFYEEDGDRLIIKSTQDVESILAHNRMLQADTTKTRTKEMRHVASIPNIIIEQWLKEGINIFQKEGWERAKKKLNDPDYRYLRTDLGTL